MTSTKVSPLCSEVKKILDCFSDNIRTIKPRNVTVGICIFAHRISKVPKYVHQYASTFPT